MIKTFTQDDLVRYIYKETTTEENSEIEQAMLFDDALAKDYAELSSVVLALDGAQVAPAQNSVDAILSYSKSYHLHSA
ncbi:hypothetical protein [Roseivirga pacifica]